MRNAQPHKTKPDYLVSCYTKRCRTTKNLHKHKLRKRMSSAFDKTFKLDVFLSIIDWLTFNIVLLSCCLMHVWPFYYGNSQFTRDVIISNLAYLIAQQMVSITLHHRRSQMATVLSNSSRTALLYAILNAAILGMLHYSVPGLLRSALMAFIVFIVVVVERMALRNMIQSRRALSSNRMNTIIVGEGGLTQKLADVMNDPWNDYNLLGNFSANGQAWLVNRNTQQKVPCLGVLEDVFDYIERNDVNEVYVSVETTSQENLKKLVAMCDKHMIRIFFIPVVTFKGMRKTKIRDFGDMYVMAQYNEPLHDVRNRIKKRIFDLVVSIIFICTLFPVILIVVAIISKLTMPGPLFFKQKRTGYDGYDFYCYKFRSMKVNKDADKVQASAHDPRITKWGAFMRHSNIDELPQFINVLKGDMSIVGPRPHMLAHTEYYSSLISDYMIRHYVKPGITGWAQTHGERGETKTPQDMERRVIKDIWYIEHWSFWLDIQIILKTVYDVIRGDKKAF